ncbi:hypothetical protein GF385_02855 [Candidatus Dependentiae bacterium]|nr:hypothetical protein [Candidatus Dependentiae bacterium]
MEKLQKKDKDFYDLQRVLFLFKKKNVDFKLITKEPKGRSLGEYFFKLLYFSGDGSKKETFVIEGELIKSENKDNIIFYVNSSFFVEIQKKDLIKFIDQKFLRIEFWDRKKIRKV